MFIQVIMKQGGSITTIIDSLCWVEEYIKLNDLTMDDVSSIRMLDKNGEHIEQKPNEINAEELATCILDEMDSFLDKDYADKENFDNLVEYVTDIIEEYIEGE